jgi:hypothetical protein
MRSAPILFLAACATTTAPGMKSGPRGFHADEHMAAAKQHDAIARNAGPSYTLPPTTTATPWFFSWDTSREHERMAAAHRSRASALYAAYEEACGDRAYVQVSISPLSRHTLGVWNTSAGLIFYLSPAAGPSERLLADLKCHRAWMMLQPSPDMEHCPLDLPGLMLDARGDGDKITLSIVIRDSSLVDELHRRAARVLESNTPK